MTASEGTKVRLGLSQRVAVEDFAAYANGRVERLLAPDLTHFLFVARNPQRAAWVELDVAGQLE
jgi:hypothetical protein